MDEAFRWAERAYESTNYVFPRFIDMDPMFDGMRENPRFRDLLTRMRADVAETQQRIEREEVEAGIR